MAGEDGSKAMKPSAYDEVPAADTVIEHRDQVKVTFKGGNVFHIQADGVDAHEVRRGGNAAWDRAEKLRKELNPDYAGPPAAPTGETTTDGTGESAEPDGASGDEPADNPEPKADEGEDKAKDPAPPEPPADPKPEKADGAAEPEVDRVYRVGDVQGVLRMVPVDAVMDFLGGDAGRVALLQGSDEARRLSRRVRATDGRCAPIFFTKVDINDRDEPPALYDGLYTLACARNLGLERVAVVMLPSGKVGAIQASIAALMRASLSADADDDELEYRARHD
jgi:hypothetical protein